MRGELLSRVRLSRQIQEEDRRRAGRAATTSDREALCS